MIEISDKHIMKYEEYLQKQHLSKNTIYIYIREANHLKEYLSQKVEEQNLNQYTAYLKSNYKAVTVNLYLVACKRFLEFCGYTDNNIKFVKIQPKQSVENVIDKADYNKMLSYAHQHGKQKASLILRTLACTGIRVSELNDITVEGLATGRIEVFNKQKYREVYLPNKLVIELDKYCREENIKSGPIFLGNRGTPISRVGVWDMIQRLAQKSGIEKEKAHPHSFRHLFAKTYMEQFGNLSELADILGHSSIEVTRRYTMSSAEEKRERMDSLPF